MRLLLSQAQQVVRLSVNSRTPSDTGTDARDATRCRLISKKRRKCCGRCPGKHKQQLQNMNGKIDQILFLLPVPSDLECACRLHTCTFMNNCWLVLRLVFCPEALRPLFLLRACPACSLQADHKCVCVQRKRLGLV